MDLYQQGNAAFVEEEYSRACELYTQALGAEPANPKILEARANAHLRLENWMDALQDAKMAAELDPKSSKALLRKGIASFHLEEYEAAKEAFDAGASLAPDNSQFQTWARKCQAELEDEKAAAQPAPAPAPAPPPQQSGPSQAASPAAAPAPPPSAAGTSSQPLLNPKLPQAPERRFRHQWYQLQSKVTVDVYAKNMSKEQVSITFGEQRLTVIIKEEGKEDYVLDVELFGQIKPEECRFEILKTKIEITMIKADGTHWADLEKSSKPSLPTPGAPAPTQYPTSNPRAHKDWNKLEAEVKELEQKGELADGDPLNNFFKKIFSQGDEAQQRAMMKSYQESNGTVLSTNWAEVGGKKVECTPPDGMEARKWEM